MELFEGWDNLDREFVLVRSFQAKWEHFPSLLMGGKGLLKFKLNEPVLICPNVLVTPSYLMAGAMSFGVSVSVVPSTV